MSGRHRTGRASPILVTGSHRSGTTWAARILHASGATGYIDEAFNPGRRPGWLSIRPAHWYQHVDAANEQAYARAVRDLLRFRYPGIREPELTPEERRVARTEWARARAYRLQRATPLMKDPLAIFSAEWLAERFGARIVLLIRHPAAFASSTLRLRWSFRFRQWTRQPALMEGYLAPFAEQIRRAAEDPPSLLDQAILQWNAIYAHVGKMRESHPDWIFVRHEDLCVSPEAEFRSLYARLGLPWGKRVTDVIEELTSPRNKTEVERSRVADIRRNSMATARIWRQRLTQEEIDRVRQGTEQVAGLFYAPEDWMV